MILEILKYRLVCDVAAGSAEVAPRPEMATPVSFAKFWELHLNAMRRAPFDTSNDVADRDMRWYLDEHVDMLFGQNARDDLYHGSSLSSSEDEGLDPKKETIKSQKENPP